MIDKKISRRGFLIGSALVPLAAGCSSLGKKAPAKIRTKSPNEKLNVGCIGVGGRAAGHVKYFHKNENVVAMCDVDDKRMVDAVDAMPGIPHYRDYRIMLDKHKDLDAVVIATPDHIHAVAAISAMELGKHVYVEKPMAHSIQEVWRMAETARRYKVATQMGNQGHAGDGLRQLCEVIWSGAIGGVKEIHCWTDRPIWPQGIKAPLPAQPVPATLDWELWLGPAPERPFGGYYERSAKDPSRLIGYLPFAWRGWWDFGCGALGDMGCHLMDPAVVAARLGAPKSVECVSQEGLSDQTGPTKSVIRYEFPERERDGVKSPATTMFWYDGNIKPPRPAGLAESEDYMGGASVMFIGDAGQLVCGPYGDKPRLLPAKRMADFKAPPETLERLPEGATDDGAAHRADFARACKGGKPAGSNFDYAAGLTETVLLGNVAMRAGTRIEWDAKAKRVTNHPEANRYLACSCRRGWHI